MRVQLVDCRYDLAEPARARERYLEAHIPGAAFLDLDADLSDLSLPAEVAGRHPLPPAEQFAAAAGRAGIGPDTLVVAYDEGMTGGAARLWWLLRHFGHEQAGVLDGGLGAWLGPLASGEEEIEPAVFTPRVRTDDTASSEEILERLGDPRLVLIDARQPERFRGESAGLDPVAGRIPGARNLPSLTGRLPELPPDIATADEIVAYCGSGVLACVSLLALHRAGRTDARLYPGSWSEWSRKRLPAEKG
ncbi:MAG TPA: rhodanese-like domain-containing protein [Gaiellaceae bacterium]|nr:rhodanese-like domain-containing protein [Gaiellaceae bacterium]